MVIIPTTVLSRFKRRASAAQPKEYIELLFGVKKSGAYCVQESSTLPQRGSAMQVWYYHDDQDDVICEHEARGLEYLGSIHTHPEGSIERPTHNDNEHCEKGEIVGIDVIAKRGKRWTHDIRWYIAQTEIDSAVVPSK